MKSIIESQKENCRGLENIDNLPVRIGKPNIKTRCIEQRINQSIDMNRIWGNREYKNVGMDLRV